MTVHNPVTILDFGECRAVPVAAGQTTQALGDNGGNSGDFLAGLWVVPAAADCGAVQIKDGAGSARTVFVGGGTVALPTLVGHWVQIGSKSSVGAWQVTTGTNVSVEAVGRFT